MLSLLLAVVLQADEPIDFKRDVRPILSDNCFKCHGPDPKGREADLRLDTKQGAFGAIDGRIPFVPGKPDKSEAWRRITTTDADDRMPPAKSGKKLTPKQIATLRKWIEQGAPWSDHWAFVTPKRPAAPATKDIARVRTPIDGFIVARLEREGLALSVDADNVTLLRRLSLDLTGLPPTIEEIDAFLKDTSPQAYEKQRDRLLASPHYGERWGRHWLDAARYADSDGYEKDKPRAVWFYRDWVIQAFNRDLPYDRFIIEQIAGDLLPNAAQEQLVATGFLRNSMINEEGGVDPEQFRMEAMFDRMDAIGKSVLGLTIQCAQCHTHKFDPISHEDYYRLFAFLNNAHEASATVYTAEQQMRRTDLLRGIREIEADLQHRTPDWRNRMSAWEEQVRKDAIEWTVIRPDVDDISNGGQKYLPLGDGSFICQGYAPTKHRVKLTVKVDAPSVTGFRLELLNDPNLPHGGPGRSIKGTAALTEFEVEAAPADNPAKKAKVKIVRATADLNLPEQPLEKIYDDKSNKKRITGPIAYAIDGKDDTAWGIDAGPGRRNHPRNAVFAPEQPVAHAGGMILTIYLKQNHGGWNSDDNQTHNLGRFRLSITSAPDPAADPLPPAVREIVSLPAQARTPAQEAALFSAYRVTVPDWEAANAKIEELWRGHPEGSTQLALLDRSDARMTYMLERGDFLKPAKSVAPGVPGFLHKFPADAPNNRLGFAQWLVDRNSPTTARSLVNRVWQAYFGTGLVGTSEDLGTQSELPTHPELLDWLAVDFMEQGWSLKKLHRLIVTSSAYRQSSRVSPQHLARDPYNRLLARGPRFRVEGEIVRDIALAASGLLNPKIGGPSVCPPAPESLFVPPASYGPKVWKEDTGPERYRRALYTFRYRSVPYPMLQAFDAPNGDFACVKRPRSNTPLQALTTLNEPLFLECAKALGALALKDGGETDEQRIAYAFRRCVARAPTATEAAVLKEFLAKQAARLEKNAAWTALARVLLNLDETITKE